MTTPGTTKTFKNTEKHDKMLFEFGGRFLASRSAVQVSPGEGLAAELGLSGGGEASLRSYAEDSVFIFSTPCYL